MPEAGDAGLQTLMVFPATPGKHPLVLMTHGSDYSKSSNQKMGPGIMQPAAIWFARRGWTVAIVERRGYGGSGGKMEKSHYGCTSEAFAAMAQDDAADLTAVFDAIKTSPLVDASTVIVTGNSAGGFAALAYAAQNPPALKAVINFSGGWHSMFFAGSCAKHGLIPAFGNLGAASHVPGLWLYAKNDGLFAPKYVALMHDAFTAAGGQVEMPVIGNSGDDGHYLLSQGVSVWSPIVEHFLQKHGLPWEDLDPEYGKKTIKLPENYPDDIKDAFARWQSLGPGKAFAVGPNGEWGYSSGRKTLKLAEDEALDRCRSFKCQVIAYQEY